MTAPTVELRDLALDVAAPTLTRAEAAPPVFFGHAWVTEARYSIGNPASWGWVEKMGPGVAARTIAEDDQRFLIDHDTALVVARRSAGDLVLSEDSTGGATTADLDTEVSYVRDLARNLEKRRITGMSIGFRVRDEDWTTERVELAGVDVEVDVRTILDIELLEVSAVTFPASPTTDAGLRSMREARGLPLTRPAHRDDTAARLLAMRHDLTARRPRR